MIGCAEAEALLHPLLDGELTEPELSQVKDHLAICSTCFQEFRDLETTRRLLREGPIPEPPPQFWELVRANWLSELKRWIPSPVATLRFAVLFMLLLVLFLIWWRQQGEAFWSTWLGR